MKEHSRILVRIAGSRHKSIRIKHQGPDRPDHFSRYHCLLEPHELQRRPSQKQRYEQQGSMRGFRTCTIRKTYLLRQFSYLHTMSRTYEVRAIESTVAEYHR